MATYGTEGLSVAIVAEIDAVLMENQLVYKLAPKLHLNETNWINPRNVA